MKHINWNTEKSLKLKELRGICFEDVVYYIERGDVLHDYEHPNQRRYSGQRIMVIGVDNHAYLVRYVNEEEALSLKTIITSRKDTEIYFVTKSK
mgnify:CR=1 FL=1